MYNEDLIRALAHQDIILYNDGSLPWDKVVEILNHAFPNDPSPIAEDYDHDLYFTAMAHNSYDWMYYNEETLHDNDLDDLCKISAILFIELSDIDEC